MTYLKEKYVLLCLIIVAHIGLITEILTGTWQEWLLTFVMYSIIMCVGMDMTYHRLLSHHSYNPPKWFEYLGPLIAVYGMLGTPLGWVSIHRDHHRYSDTETDPHSPYFKSKIHIMWLIALTEKLNYKNSMDVLRNKYLMFLHLYYVEIHLVILLVLAIINPRLAICLYLAPAAVSWDMGNILNIVVHKWGYRNFETRDQSRNFPLIAYLTFGEGWHNNHHSRPQLSQFRVQWWELDIAGWLIKKLDPSAV